jgi:DNA-binding CsgD family transcriptional regulator
MGESVDLLGALYDAALNQEAWGVFLTRIAASYGHAMAALVYHDSLKGEVHLRARGTFDDAMVKTYNDHYGKINPLIPLARKSFAVGEVNSALSLIDIKEWHKTEAYQDWFRPNNFGMSLGVLVQKAAGHSISFTLGLSPDWLEKGDEALNRLRILSPHVLRAVQIQQELSGLPKLGSFTEGILERTDASLIVLNEAGRVMWINANAESVISANDGLTIRDGAIRARHSSDDALLIASIAAALTARVDITKYPGEVMRVHRPSEKIPYELLVIPIAANVRVLGLEPPAIYVFVRDPSLRRDSPFKILHALYGLSRSESRLFLELVGGNDLNVASQNLNLTKESGRTILKTIFRKTGTHKQTELIRLGLLSVSSIARG